MYKSLISIIFVFVSSWVTAQDSSLIYRNLVLEGGGVRGIAYVGALMELKDRGILDSITRVAGTSAGAIAATLFAVGYSPEEILRITSDVNIKSFADGRWMFIGGSRRFVKKFGWYRGEKFAKWIGELIEAKTGKANLTFQELKDFQISNSVFRQLYLTGTNLSLQQSTILCHETFPNMEVRTGVRISMSIPLYFQAVIIDEDGQVCIGKDSSEKGFVMVDGGILMNYPIHIFDYQKYLDGSTDSSAIVNVETLGLRLDEENQIVYDKAGSGLSPLQIKTMKDYTFAFYNIIIENLNRQRLTKSDWERTISISTGGIGPKIKRMRASKKNLLVANGRRGVREYFSSNEN